MLKFALYRRFRRALGAATYVRVKDGEKSYAILSSRSKHLEDILFRIGFERE